MANPYEQRARDHKVVALVAKARDLTARRPGTQPDLLGIADGLAAASDERWQNLAHQAGVKPPSDDTKREVVAMLRMLAANPVPADPFDGVTG